MAASSNPTSRWTFSSIESVANKLGIELPISIEKRIAGAEKVGEHRTSRTRSRRTARRSRRLRSGRTLNRGSASSWPDLGTGAYRRGSASCRGHRRQSQGQTHSGQSSKVGRPSSWLDGNQMNASGNGAPGVIAPGAVTTSCQARPAKPPHKEEPCSRSQVWPSWQEIAPLPCKPR